MQGNNYMLNIIFNFDIILYFFNIQFEFACNLHFQYQAVSNVVEYLLVKQNRNWKLLTKEDDLLEMLVKSVTELLR